MDFNKMEVFIVLGTKLTWHRCLHGLLCTFFKCIVAKFIKKKPFDILLEATILWNFGCAVAPKKGNGILKKNLGLEWLIEIKR